MGNNYILKQDSSESSENGLVKIVADIDLRPFWEDHKHDRLLSYTEVVPYHRRIIKANPTSLLARLLGWFDANEGYPLAIIGSDGKSLRRYE